MTHKIGYPTEITITVRVLKTKNKKETGTVTIAKFHSVMVEDKNIIDKLCIDIVKESTNSFGFASNCDNAHIIQHLKIENCKEHRPFQFGVRDGEKKLQEVTVIGADHNSLNANSTIDSRACYKPKKKVIKKKKKIKIIRHKKKLHTKYLLIFSVFGSDNILFI